MGRRITASMTLTRTHNVVTFVDAAGVQTIEPQDIEIEGEVSGFVFRAEPDVGIMWDCFEDVSFKADSGFDCELTDKEMERAEDLLGDALNDWED
jgi:hypothetical protein